MAKGKFALCKILLILVGLTLGGILAEIIANIYLTSTKLNEKLEYISNSRAGIYPNIVTDDKDLGWGYKPGAKGIKITSEFDVEYSINSKGIRDKEISIEKSNHEFRVLALGESTVFGEGVNYGGRFTEIIEKSLDNVEVINMGVQGFGMDQSFLQLKRDGFKFKPDLIILFIIKVFLERCKDTMMAGRFKPRFVLNANKDGIILQDLNFVKEKFSKKIPSELNNSSNEKAENSNKKNDLIRKSKTLILLNYYRKRKNIKTELEERDKNFWSNFSKLHLRETKDRKRYKEEDFKKLIYFLLKKYKDACEKHGIDFLIVYMEPCKIDYLKDFCKERGISYLDLSIVLNNASRFKPLRFEIDPHYNEFTHRVIGEYVSDYLKNKYHLEENCNYSYQFLGKF